MGEQSTVNLLNSINNSLNKIVELMLPQNKDRSGADEVKTLSQGGLSSSGPSKGSSASSVSGIVGGIEIAKVVSALDGLPESVKAISKLSGSTIRRFENVMRSIVSIFTDEKLLKIDNDSTKAAAELIKALGGLASLPESIQKMSKMKERDVNRFAKSIVKIIEAVSKALAKANITPAQTKQAKDIAETIGILSTSAKSMAKMTLWAPLALVGVLAMIPVYLTFGLLLTAIGALGGPLLVGLNVTRRMNRMMRRMFKTALFGIVVAGAVVLLGTILKSNMDLMLYGLGGLLAVFVAIGAIAILGGLIGLLIKSTSFFRKQILLFTAGLIVIAMSIILLGLLLKETWKEAMLGLAGMTVMLLYMMLIAVAAYVVGLMGVEMVQLKIMAGLLLLTMGLIAITALTVMLGKYVSANAVEALAGLAATIVILGEVYLVARVARRVGNQAKTGILNILLCEAVVLAAHALIFTTIETGKYLWDYFGTEENALAKIGLSMAASAAIIMGALGVSRIANMASKSIKQGAKSLVLAQGVILISSVVLAAMIGVAYLLENSGVQQQSIVLTLSIMGAIVAGAGAVALIAAKLGNNIKKGALMMAVIELLILGMVGVVYGIVKTAEAANKLNNGWLDVLAAVGFMVGLIVVFTAFAVGIGLMSANPYVAAALTIGLTVLGALTIMTLMVTVTTFKVVELAKKLEDTGKTPEDLGKVLHEITHNVLSFDNLNPDLSLRQAAVLSLKYLALMPALLGISLVVAMVSDMARKFGGLSEKRGDDYYISPYYGMNGNTPVFGEPVNVPGIATQIVEAVTIFANRLFEGFESVDLGRLVAVGITMTSLVEPVSKFAQMVSGFKNGNNPGELKPVFVTSDGKITYGDTVNVIEVANSIAGAISAFATTLYGNGDELPKWMQFMKKRRNRKTLERAMNTFAEIIEPVDKFVEMLLGFQSTNPGFIKRVMFDDKGNYINNGAPEVNVVNVATAIASAISSFATILYGNGDKLPEWMKMFRRDSRADTISKAMGSLANIVEPISAFAQTMAMMDSDGTTIYAVSVDDKGNITKRPVNIVHVSESIASAISKFLKILFDKDTTDAWMNMIHVYNGTTPGSKLMEATGSEEKENSMGILAMVIEPVAQFARMLIDMNGEMDGDTLAIPVYDNEGKLLYTRKVNLVSVASAIATSVSTFLKTLFSDENIAMWESLIYKKTANGTQQDSHLADSIGVFASLIEPIVTFAEVISSFDGDENNLVVFDGDTKRVIHPIEIAKGLASAVTSFMTTLKPAFDGIEFTAEERQKVDELANAIGGVLENFVKIGETKPEQIDLAASVIDKYFTIVSQIKTKLDNNEFPDASKITDMRQVMENTIPLFNIYKDVDFSKMNYEEGLAQFKHIVDRYAEIQKILINITNANDFSFLPDFLAAIQTTDSFTRNITEGLNIEAVKSGSSAVSILATTYKKLPEFDESVKKLAFVSEYVNAMVPFMEIAADNVEFSPNVVSMVNLIEHITKSILDLGTIEKTELDGVSNSYNTMLTRMVNLSSKNNRNSLKVMGDNLQGVTISMINFDNALIRKSNDRRKKLDELIEIIGKLNEKLDETSERTKKISEYIAKIAETDIKGKLNDINNSNASGGYSGGYSGGNENSGEQQGGTGGVQTIQIDTDNIEMAIRNALTKIKLNSTNIPFTGTFEEETKAFEPLIKALAQLDFEFTE
jgi:hypothetical protein